MALPKKHRLDKKGFRRVFKEGKTVKNSFFFIHFLKNKVGYGRAAVVVATKISRRIINRNRLRRMIAEAVSASNFYRSPFDVIFIAAPDIVGRSPEEIKSILTRVIDNLFVNPVRSKPSPGGSRHTFGRADF